LWILSCGELGDGVFDIFHLSIKMNRKQNEPQADMNDKQK